MSETAHPPKPAAAIRVGVTGHRLQRLDASQRDRIARQTRYVLKAATDAVDAALQTFRDDYARAPAKHYFVSALADGADTLAAEAALDLGWRLLAPLPFSRNQYETDFSDDDVEALNALLAHADAVAELDGGGAAGVEEENAYLQAGLVTLKNADIVIAIWDGEKARGPGGTAMIKNAALAAGKPVVWINAVKDTAPVLLTADGQPAEATHDVIESAVSAILAPPSPSEIEHEFSGKRTHALIAYRDYINEKPHGFNFGSFFQFWEKALAGRWPFTIRLTVAKPESQIAEALSSTLAMRLNAAEGDRRIFEDIIAPRFEWADHLAVHYGNLYRSSYFFNYLFAAIAVFLALFHLVAGVESKIYWISVEVAIIVFILAVTVIGRRGRWHEKWIDYRQLTEELRQFRHVFLTAGEASREEEKASGEDAEDAGWVDWYLKAAQREAGLTSGRFDAAAMKKIAAAIVDEEIRPQIAYHERKAQALHKIEHRLHLLGEAAFAATFVVCIGYLLLAFSSGGGQGWAYALKSKAQSWVTLLTGFLPALGAAFFGIRVQGEFGSTAERSHATAATLKAIAAKFDAVIAADAPKLSELQARVEEAARAMLMENMDWRLLYISKPLNLPG